MRTVSTVPAGTTKGLGASDLADFIFDIFDIAEPELLDPEAVLSPGEAGALAVLLLSFEFDALESAGLLLQPSTTKQR